MVKLFWWAKRTLRVRLTAWYIFLFGSTLLIFSSYLYLQLKYSLLSQVDTALEITTSEILTNLSAKNGRIHFKDTEQFKLSQQQLTNAGYAVRIVGNNGQIWDSFGNYQTIPLLLTTRKGYINLTVRATIWRVYNLPLAIAGNEISEANWLKSNGQSERILLQVAQSLQPVSQALDHLLLLIVFGFPIVLLLAGLGGLFLADRALRPINNIIKTAEAISPDDFSRRIDYQGVKDEVGRLAMTLDKMFDRIELAFEHERRFIADASHELRTPLTVIKGRIDVTLSRRRTPAEYETTLLDLEQETDRLIRLTNGLLFLARLEQDELEGKGTFFEVDLSHLLEVLIEQIQPLAEERQINIVAKISPQLLVMGNCDLLTSLFLNLLDNAIKYTPSQGQVKLEANKNKTQILVTISNTGTGIADQHLPFVFERFYRIEGDRSRNTGGAGLGLAIAASIVRCHGGKIAVNSYQLTNNSTNHQFDKVTTFEVVLPRQ
jgi:heavy metal sensor kinase